MKKTVTVAIPVYNGSRFIEKTLESIVNQTQKVDQILVSDNCSSDDTVQIVEEFAKSHKDFNIKINVNESNLGYQRNYNKCMEMASTDYFLLLSSDDRLKPFAIEHQFQYLEDHPEIALVGGQVDFIDENGNTTREANTAEDLVFQKGEFMEFLVATNAWINPATVLLKKSCVEEVGYWDEHSLGPDERWWPKVLTKNPIAIRGESVLEFRRHLGQNGWKDSAYKSDLFLQYLKANLKLADLETDTFRKSIAEKHLRKWAATRCITVGKVVWINYKRPAVGFKYFVFGFKQYPKAYFSKVFLKSFARSIFSLIALNK